MAVVSRLSTRTLAPTVGQISDDQGNHWLQAVEYFTANHYGVDIWYCEVGRWRQPADRDGEMSGLSGPAGDRWHEDDRCSSTRAHADSSCATRSARRISPGRPLTATTNFDLESNDELAISAIVGNMSSATVPSGWNSRLADVTQGCYVADTLSSGGSSAGAPLSAAWTGLTGAQGGRGSRRHVRPSGRVVEEPALGAVVLHGFRDSSCGKGSSRGGRHRPTPSIRLPATRSSPS